MWQTLSSRRELVEFFNGQQSLAAAVEQPSISTRLPEAEKEVVLYWRENPSTRGALPVLAVMNDNQVDSFFALINALPSAPSPFTSLCRTISASDAIAYSQSTSNDGNRQVIDALIGLSYAEALVHASGTIRSNALSPAICKRTFTIAWAKSLKTGIPVASLPNLVEGWLEASSLSSSPDRAAAMHKTVSATLPILRVAAELYYGLPSSTTIGSLCHALLTGDKVAQELAWKDIEVNLSEAINLSQLSNATREERGAYFQSAMRNLYSKNFSNDEIAPAICAFLATQIAPGSLEHIDFLLAYPDPRLVLWYGFMGALQHSQDILRFSSGLGTRLLRDIDRRESFEVGPVADISLRELRVLSRASFDSIARKLGHSNEIEVEVLPLVSCSFRYQARQGKQPELFDKNPSAIARREIAIPTNQARLFDDNPSPSYPARKETAIPVEEKINDIIKMLEELASSLPTEIKNHLTTKGIKKRTRK